MLPIFALLVLLCVHFWRAKFSSSEGLRRGVFQVKITLNNLGSSFALQCFWKECGASSSKALRCGFVWCGLRFFRWSASSFRLSLPPFSR